jgi:hypothetical protein
MHTTDPNSGESPVTGLPLNAFAGGVDDAAIKRGHEVDNYDSKLVLSVPALVVVFFILAFITVTIVFSFVSKSEPDPKANPFLAKYNQEPLNERLGGIHRGSDKVNQPRLEPLVTRWSDERSITRPPTPTGNSPEIHPEDIIPSKENTPELFESGWQGAKHDFGHITIDKAMDEVRDKIKVQPQQVQPLPTTHLPSASNAGRGFGPSTVVPPKLPKESDAGGQKK